MLDELRKKIKFDQLYSYCQLNNVLAMYLFGSQLAGDNDKFSDLDLGVVFCSAEKEKLTDVNFYIRFKNGLMDYFDFADIDLLFLQNSGLKIAFEVIKRGELIYSADKEKRLNYEDMVICRGLDFKMEISLYYEELQEEILDRR
ncbi:MAG: type VII toxin-antitoxin system MntA family adenylyltransferase antitoxin [Halanaerobiales bacterium]